MVKHDCLPQLPIRLQPHLESRASQGSARGSVGRPSLILAKWFMAEGDKQVTVNKATDFDPLTPQMLGAFLARRRLTGMIRYFVASPTSRGWFKTRPAPHRSCAAGAHWWSASLVGLRITGERKRGLCNCGHEKWGRMSRRNEDIAPAPALHHRVNMGQRCDKVWHDRSRATRTRSVRRDRKWAVAFDVHVL